MKPKVTFSEKIPKCFDTRAEYRAWKQCARMAYPALWVCTDCTPDYQERMKAQGRCENPQVQFQQDESGSIEGVVYLSLFKGEENADARI